MPPAPSTCSRQTDAIERWAEAQRASLQRLAYELHHLRAASSARFFGPLESDELVGDDGPGDDLASVDRWLLYAVADLDSDLDAARVEAAGVVDDARRRAVDLLEAAGVDAATIEQITSVQLESGRSLARPRRAAELWLDLGRPAAPKHFARARPRSGEYDEFWGEVPPRRGHDVARSPLRRWVQRG